jgi:YVTN family beta-propeller protein
MTSEVGSAVSFRGSSGSRHLAALSLIVLAPFLAVALSASPSSGAPYSRPASGTVYVTNLDTNAVTVVNASSRATSTIRAPGGGLNGPLGIAIAPNAKTAYVTNSLSNTVTPIDLATNPPTPQSPIHVGSGPAAIAITANGDMAYVTNFNANTVTPIDLATNPPTPQSPIHVGSGPWSIAISPNGTKVCVADSESDSVSVIDTATRKVTTLQVSSRPQAIAVSPNGAYAYVANGNVVTPIDIATSPARVGSPIAVGNGPVGIAISPNGAFAYTANTNNSVTPIDLKTSPATPETSVPVGTLSQPDGITVSPNGATAYAANASNEVTPIDLKTSPISPEAPIQVGTASFGIAVAPDQAPIAHLKVVPAKVGRRTVLNASASRSPNDRIVKYVWSFGDGGTATTKSPRSTHVYFQAGRYTASVTETSADGTSLRRSFTGQTVSNNGGPSAAAKQVFSVGALLVLSPPSGAPGRVIALRDDAFTKTCSPVYVFFDNKLIAQTGPVGRVLDDKQVVIPGDASLGRHRIELSCTTSKPWLLSAQFVVVGTENHLSEFSVAMPAPGELKKHLADAGGMSLLMLLVSRIIAGGFPSEWLDNTYAANRERISARARRRFPKFFIDRDRPRSFARRIAGGTAIFIGFVAGAGLINSFLIPSFGFNRTTLWLFLGQCVGVSILTLSWQVTPAIAGVRGHHRVHLQVLIGGMLIAVFCVSFSRVLGLSPGYCYGLIAVLLLRPEPDDERDGQLNAISAAVVMVVSTAALFLTVPVYHAATSANPSPFVLVLNPALNVVFMAGFASLAFGMFPLPFLPGQHVAKWSRIVWFAIGAVGLVGFVAVLLSPGSGTSSELKHVALVPLLTAFVLFGLISLGFMAYFHIRPNPMTQDEPAALASTHDQAPLDPVAHDDDESTN